MPRNNRYFLHTLDVSAIKDVASTFVIPEGSRSVQIRLADPTLTWRWSAKANVVETPANGFPMAATEKYASGDVEHSKQTIYLAHSSNLTETFKVSYLIPRGPR